jgi:hypothetical protein
VRKLLFLGLFLSGTALAECPPFPSFPDASCTGWEHTGVTLTNHASSCTLSTANATYDSKRFNCDIIIAANNITITRSEINGVVNNNNNYSGMVIEDTLIDGGNGGQQCVGRSLSTGITSAGFTLRRAHIKNCNQAVYAARFTVIDSFLENINGDGTDHIESILGTGPGPLVVQHTTIFGEANEESGPWNPDDGGVSAAVAFYVHGTFWPDINGITFEQNYLRGNPGGDRQAGYCLYGGESTAGDGHNSSNAVFRDNVFARGTSGVCGSYGPVVSIASGTNTCWSNNRYDDGTEITSGRPACTASEVVRPNPPTSQDVE